MKRRLLLIVLLLLVAGAIVNIAVAWEVTLLGRAFDVQPIAVTSPTDSHSPSDYAAIGRVGWPVRAMSYVYHVTVDPSSRNIMSNHYTTDSLQTPGGFEWIGLPEGRTLPLRPIWPGFAINTVFYAAVLWLLFAAPLALRRRRRIKRGLCPKCAYDLRGTAIDSTTCPECGATVTVE